MIFMEMLTYVGLPETAVNANLSGHIGCHLTDWQRRARARVDTLLFEVRSGEIFVQRSHAKWLQQRCTNLRPEGRLATNLAC